jgi:hypothetical protein
MLDNEFICKSDRRKTRVFLVSVRMDTRLSGTGVLYDTYVQIFIVFLGWVYTNDDSHLVVHVISLGLG